MFGFWRNFDGLLPYGFVALVVAVATAVLWRSLSRRGQRVVAWLWLLTATAAVVLVTLTPQTPMIDKNNVVITRALEIVPFQELYYAAFSSVSWRVAVEQIGGNILLFLPVGIGLALLKLRAPRGLAFGFVAGAGLGIMIESLQWILGLGRVSSVDDVILACLGTGIGNLVGQALVSRSSRHRDAQRGTPASRTLNGPPHGVGQKS